MIKYFKRIFGKKKATLKNVTLKTYVKRGMYYSVLETVKGKPLFAGKELIIRDLTYNEVKGVMAALSGAKNWDDLKNIFGTCFKITEAEFWKGRVMEFYESRNYIYKEFNKLAERERKLLKSVEDVDSLLWKEAGGERLSKFGAVLPINQLGKLYNIYPFKLKDKKYEEILLLLTLNKTQGEVDKKFAQLKSKVK